MPITNKVEGLSLEGDWLKSLQMKKVPFKTSKYLIIAENGKIKGFAIRIAKCNGMINLVSSGLNLRLNLMNR